MMLAIDTSSAASSVALVDVGPVGAGPVGAGPVGAGPVVREARHVDARRHAEVLANLVAQVLGDVRPTVVAVGVGPGPYTGLRVGVTTAQALGHAWGVPVIGACSLDVIARAAVDLGIDEPFAVATDARRREVYWASFDPLGRRLAGPFVERPADIAMPNRRLPWVGEGALLHADELMTWRGGTTVRFPQPIDLAHLVAEGLAAGEMPVDPVARLARHGEDDGSTSRALAGRRLLTPYPLYVRRPDAAEPGERP